MMKRYVVKMASLILIALILAGCSTSQNSIAMSSEEAKSEMAVEDRGEQVSDVTQGSSDGIQLNTTIQLNRKIIKTGKLDIETKAFDKTTQDIVNQANQVGGFLQDCMIEGDGRYSDRTANLTIRIPNETFDTFMNDTDKYGNVVTKGIEGQDVTDQYMDTEMRLSALQIQAERLQELLKQAGKLQDLFEIEKELANVTYEIESLKGSLKKYDSLIDYSTINISVREMREYQEVPQKPVTFTDKMITQFKQSTQAVGNLLKGCVLIIVGMVPFVIVIVPIAIICYFVLRKVRRKQTNIEHKNDSEV